MAWETDSLLEIKKRAKILHGMLRNMGADVRYNAEQLSWIPTLADDNIQISKDIDKVIGLLEQEHASATTDAQKAEVLRKVQALAASLTKITDGVIASINAIQSGDPYATSAAVLDLCGTLVSSIGAIAGPQAAAAGALVGSLLSVVSTILKQFIPQPPPLTKQIEDIIRKIGSEEQQQKLKAAQGSILHFMNMAKTTKFEWTFEQVLSLLNPVEGNVIFAMRLADAWLLEPSNQHLPLWGEVLELRVRNLMMLKVALALWFPVIKVKDRDQVIEAFSGGDDVDLEFLEKVKPAARSRGTIWHVGVPGSLYASDTPGEAPKKFGDVDKYGVVAVAKQNGQAVARPHLSILFSDPREPEIIPAGFDHAYHMYDKPSSPHVTSNPQYHKALHRFRQKGQTRMCCGQWPLDDRQWLPMPELEGCYDIWAIPGKSKGAVSVYAATGQTIRHYEHASHERGKELSLVWQSQPVDGYKVGAVRVAPRPRPSSGEAPAILTDVTWAIYGLCEVSEKKSVVAGGPLRDCDHFEIQAFYSDGVKGCVLPPWDAEWNKKGVWLPWGNVAGIATDSEHLWVFRAGEIACATHGNVKQGAKTGGGDVNWVIYAMPSTLGNYDPSKRIFHGLRDLSPCEDGTLTVVFNESSKAYGTGSTDGPARICTSTPRFESGPNGRRLVIEGWKPGAHNNAPVRTDGWNMDKASEASRIIKEQLFCFPLVEKLEADLSAPKGAKPSKRIQAAEGLTTEFSRSRIDLGSYIEEQRSLLLLQKRPGESLQAINITEGV